MTKDEKIDAMYNALVGNNSLGVKGLVDQVKENSKDISTIKKKIIWVTGFVAAVVMFLKTAILKILALLS